MAYQQRARNFAFMGATGVGRVVEVVPEREESPALMRPPLKPCVIVGGTVSLDVAAFARERGAIRLASR